jgi:hypothetical protein
VLHGFRIFHVRGLQGGRIANVVRSLRDRTGRVTE